MRTFGKALTVLGTVAVGMAAVAMIKKPSSIYSDKPEEKNPMEGKKVRFVEDSNEKENADGVRGHLEAVGTTAHKAGVYEKYIKRCLDVVLSFGGLVILSPVLMGLSVAIVMDDPGPVLFTQKRIGKDKQYFKLHKFRSMKMSTPHDKPTHMLENPEQYIAKSRTTTKTKIYCTRYGNVMCSRGSVIPLWIDQIRNRQPITITDPSMTRFIMSLEEAVDLVLFAFEHGQTGDIFVQKAPACTIMTQAEAVCELFGGRKEDIKIIGIRHGEKMYETLLTNEECAKAEDMGQF